MISFIVTTYNLDDLLLRRCLSSIVGQGLARDEYEIIVVDDESAVSPQHVVAEFAHQASITLYVQRHARQGAARNLALSHAKGQWVQFVDGDDYLFPHTIAPLLRSAEAHALDLLMFTFREVHDEQPVGNGNENNCQLSKLRLSESKGCLQTLPSIATSTKLIVPCQLNIATGDCYMHHHNLFGSCCMQMFRRHLLDAPQHGAPLRFTEGIYIEDEEFVTHLVWRAQRMARVDVPVYAYYQRAGSTVHSRSREHTDELFSNSFAVLGRLLQFEASLAGVPHGGVTRKVRFLAVDILRRSLREPNWQERWSQSAHQLSALGLYPIPAARYSAKYSLFRLLASSRLGRWVLHVLERG